MDSDAFAEAGLFDPAAPDAADRLALLRYVAEAGVSVEEMVQADRQGNLTVAVFDHRLGRGELSAAAIAERAGVAIDDVVEAYRLLGIAVEVGAPVFAPGEERILELFAGARELFPPGTAEEILRSIGSGLATIAESAVAAFVGSVESGLEEGSQAARAETTTAAGDLGLELGALLRPLLRHHLWAAVERQRHSMRGAVDRRESELSVGFVDLVGFTPTTGQMRAGELLSFISDFHARTFDVVTRSRGRVVKHIGDEVMFTAGSASVACEIALGLVEAFEELTSPPRGGIAHGVVVARHGDVYGPVVNLAARLADIAVPGEVLAGSSVAEASDDDRFEFEPAGRRLLKGFADPVRVVAVHRAPA